MVRALAIALTLAACSSGGGTAGSPCTRNSDCRSRVCTVAGTCDGVVDAGTDAELDAMKIPPLPTDAPDAGVDVDAMVDAP